MKGEVVYLYAFDVANEIITRHVEDLQGFRPVPFEIRSDHTFPRDIPLYKPVAFEPTRQTTMHGKPVRIQIRIYDVGVISIMLRVSFEEEALNDLLPYHKPVLESRESLDQFTRKMCSDACKQLKEFMVHSVPPSEPEAYTVFCLTDIGPERDVSAWI